jgi:hypothetical protein
MSTLFGQVGHLKAQYVRNQFWNGLRIYSLYMSQDYIGGNPISPVNSALPGMREQLWQTGFTGWDFPLKYRTQVPY